MLTNRLLNQCYCHNIVKCTLFWGDRTHSFKSILLDDNQKGQSSILSKKRMMEKAYDTLYFKYGVIRIGNGILNKHVR